jgi:hypothetical protein
MRKKTLLTAGLFFFSISTWAQTNPCDLNGDGRVDATDVQAAINMSVGVSTCAANIAGPNVCNVIVVQRVINASMGGSCLTSSGLHVVSVTWTPSGSSNVTNYKVYRSTTSGGPYALVQMVGAVSSFNDTTVLSGTTYFYVITALDNTGAESGYSNETRAAVSTP